MQLNQSDFKSAAVSLTKAHDLQPDNAEFAYHLALALQANGEVAQSQALLKELVRRGGFSELDAAKNLLASQLKIAGQIAAGTAIDRPSLEGWFVKEIYKSGGRFWRVVPALAFVLKVLTFWHVYCS